MILSYTFILLTKSNEENYNFINDIKVKQSYTIQKKTKNIAITNQPVSYGSNIT